MLQDAEVRPCVLRVGGLFVRFDWVYIMLMLCHVSFIEVIMPGTAFRPCRCEGCFEGVWGGGGGHTEQEWPHLPVFFQDPKQHPTIDFRVGYPGLIASFNRRAYYGISQGYAIIRFLFRCLLSAILF